MIDALQEILFTLGKNKLRTFLTAFGVVWGIFLLILLLGAGKGLENGVRNGFSSDVQDSVWINSRKTSVPYMGLGINRDITLTAADMDAIMREVPEVKIVSAENPVGSVNRSDIVIKTKNHSQSFGVFGVADNYFHIKAYQELRRGRKLDSLDNGDTRKVATIGTRVAEALFPDENPVGQSIEIDHISFKVVGVFYDKGWEGRMSERIYIPMTIYQKVFGQGDGKVRLIAYEPKPGVDSYAVEDKVMALLKKRHKVAPNDRSAIRSDNLLRGAEKFNQLFFAINGFIWFVGVSTMAAGIVGISNIMMITVKERTVEIGVRKALGATPFQIISSLLFESVMVTAVAGYIGLVLGVGFIELVNYFLTKLQIKLTFFQNPEVNFSVAITAIVILVSVGCLAGFPPAWRASRISPVEAMREK